jgi:hypothetical protein
MCGRFTVKATRAELIALYQLTMDAPPHICGRATTSARPIQWTWSPQSRGLIAAPGRRPMTHFGRGKFGSLTFMF